MPKIRFGFACHFDKILKPGTSQKPLARRKVSISIRANPLQKLTQTFSLRASLQTIKMQKPHAANVDPGQVKPIFPIYQ